MPGNTAGLMIQTSDLRKEFDGLVAVDNLTLTIPEGEIYGLIGPNGAGKTTTIRMMAGLLAPTSGTVAVAGEDVKGQTSRAQRHLGYLSDFFGVYEDLKVWEYLDYFANAYKVPQTEIGPRVTQAIAEAGLATKRSSIIRDLSRGMKQRLGIARAIIHRPKVLLLDEPASGLDPKARMDLRSLLLLQQSLGATILISSHILPELEGLCTSIGIMEKGKLVRSGRIADVLAAENPHRVLRMQWIGSSESLARSVLEKHELVSQIVFAAGSCTFSFRGSDDEIVELLSELVKNGTRVLAFGEVKETVEDLYMKVSRHQTA